MIFVRAFSAAIFAIFCFAPVAFADDCVLSIVAFVVEPVPGDVPPFPSGELSARVLDKHLFDLENYRLGDLEGYNIRWRAYGDDLGLVGARMLRLAQSGVCTFAQFETVKDQITLENNRLRTVHFEPYRKGLALYQEAVRFTCDERAKWFPERIC